MLYLPCSLRRCTACLIYYPATSEFFYKDRTRLKTTCVKCCLIRFRKQYEADPEPYKQRSKQQRTNNPEGVARYQSRYRQINKDALRRYHQTYYLSHRTKWLSSGRKRRLEKGAQLNEYKRHWRLTNGSRIRQHEQHYRSEKREAIRASSKRWRDVHPEKKLADTRNRRAVKHNAEGRHTGKDIERQYKHQQGRCYWCSIELNHAFHADHVIPLVRNGSNWPDNIVCACAFCNQSKGDKLPYSEWTPPNPLVRN